MAGVWVLPVPLLPLLQPRPRPGVAALTLLPRYPPGSQRLHSEDDLTLHLIYFECDKHELKF